MEFMYVDIIFSSYSALYVDITSVYYLNPCLDIREIKDVLVESSSQKRIYTIIKIAFADIRWILGPMSAWISDRKTVPANKW